MPRIVKPDAVLEQKTLEKYGLSPVALVSAVNYVHATLDTIDEQLMAGGGDRLASLVELANLSAIIGNLLRAGLAKAPGSCFEANRPHAFPDLLSRNPAVEHLEIKVALETNKPKGHLPKPGNHLTCRYVLGKFDGNYASGKENRGNVVWIWELRIGSLNLSHFNCSNTEGDSGKTAVINAAGIQSLRVAYCDLDFCPFSKRGKNYKEYVALLDSHTKRTVDQISFLDPVCPSL